MQGMTLYYPGMLYKPEYLDIDTLDGYIATIEGGLRESETWRTVKGRGGRGGATVGLVRGEAGGSSETENTLNLGDHHVLKLKRLIDACRGNPDSSGWVDVLEPDNVFPDIGSGALMEWECDVYMPEFSSLMANGKEISQTIRSFNSLLPFAASSGWDTTGMPDPASLEEMGSFLEAMDSSPVIVGERDDTKWKIIGTLDKRWIASDAQFDGPYKIVGKVRKTVSAGKWYPLLSLPGVNAIDRKRRRQMERLGPSNSSEENQFIPGPVVILSILSVYT